MWPAELKKGWSVTSRRRLLVAGRRRWPRLRPRPPRSRRSRHRPSTSRRARWPGSRPTPLRCRRTLTRSRWRRGPTRRRCSPDGRLSRSERRRSSRRGTRRPARCSGARTSRRASTPRSSSAARRCRRCSTASGDRRARRRRSRRLDPRRSIPQPAKREWTTAVRGPGYASPIELTFGGVPQIVTMTTRSVIGVDDGNRHAAVGVSVRRRMEREHRHADRRRRPASSSPASVRARGG